MTVSPTLDYYLVMTGPWLSSALGRNTSLWVIDYVYLFHAQQLLAEKQRHGVKIGFATSVQKEEWKAAEIYPTQVCRLLPIVEEQGHSFGYSNQE